MVARQSILLLDNSAWSRSLLPNLPSKISGSFSENLRARQFGVCVPFRLEAGYSARNSAEMTEMSLTFDQLPEFELDPETQSVALDCQIQLAAVGHHRIAGADLLIAAIAHVNDVGVIHYDADYDMILEHSNLRFESRWLAPRGSL